ncbi:sensor domain-containing protein [Simiduia agarivorans]|uniref:cyclic-guanylate-specific phosphodiesterase n=1 Tax=Simiduia agarivorans (strain DSM 21679 / JCM 13881 / BCRC 17597 / SA1) TaxID=1117647 RepID=K4KP14_SIMAS|nr:EAL domain-containing protein [Simiduia agarivorans]AFV00920.1 eal and ggdef domain containing protein [Simiduia agarivorans SA1 = DSM 21679]
MKAIAKGAASETAFLAPPATPTTGMGVPWFWDCGADRLTVGARFNKFSSDRQRPARMVDLLACFSGVDRQAFADQLAALASQPGSYREQLLTDYRRQPVLLSAECVSQGLVMGQLVPAQQFMGTELESFVLAMHQPACLWDYDLGLVACNTGFEALTGWNERQLRKLSGTENILTCGMAVAIEPDHHRLCEQLKAGQAVVAEVQLELAARPVRMRYTPLKMGPGRSDLLLLECISIDAADGQPRELRQLIDQIQDIILYLDQWGEVKVANRCAREFFAGAEPLGQNLIELFEGNADLLPLHRDVLSVVRHNRPRLDEKLSVQFRNKRYWFDVDQVPTSDTLSGAVDGVLLVLRDISESVHVNRQLLESEHRYQAFISNCMDGIWCCQIDPPVAVNLPVEQQVDLLAQRAVFTECNQQMAVLRERRAPSDLLGEKVFDQGLGVHRATVREFVQSDYQLVEAPSFRHMEDGRRLELTVSTIGIVEQGQLVHVWGITRDVTERYHAMARMEYQAHHDSLTGLPNRHALYKTIRTTLDERAPEQAMALLLIDLNRFKDLNDALGHQVGDSLLKQVGPRLREELSESDAFIARLGGDEFAIFLPAIRNPQQAVVAAHRVLDAIKQPYNIDGFHTEMGAAVGIALRSAQANDVSHLMRYADVAMYQAKSEYSGVVVYSAAKDPNQGLRFSLISELRRAIREQELLLNFQPKIELQSRRVHGFEALVRWQHPTQGFIPPAEFIPMAEATDVIHPLTEWVLEQSIRQCKQWHAQNFFVTVAVNLSARNLLDEKLPHKVTQLLEKYQLPAVALELEITESAIVLDPDRALMILNQLSEQGVRISIDDFGTGYSSLAYLKKLPVNALKIDRSFVMDMLTDRQDEVIVKSTVNLAHNLGLHVVAEGVENERTLQALAALGCNQAQGYHLGRPMPEGQVLDWFRASPWKADAQS